MGSLDSNTFNRLYLERGIHSQRRYPNENLIGFLAENFFHLSQSERRQCRILELGCGSGANIWMLAKEGFDSWGIDLSPAGIELCKQVVTSWGVSARLEVGNMTELPYSDNDFDAIIDVVSMQHLTRLQHIATISEVYRCLKPGGHFFSYHLGKKSSVCQAEDLVWYDEMTISDIPSGYPLAGNGVTSFLDVQMAEELYVDFSSLDIASNYRCYAKSSACIEYLSISAKK